MLEITPNIQMASGKLLYSREEAAAMLGLSVHTIARDVRRGLIQARHYGRRCLIPAVEIRRIAEQGMVAHASQ